ncbi:unnamed protein product [Amoebophrya sp. A120]|nr:unnamed protein product [Amoebophrya sp. A120]|eukprot:GSA120T00025395001.1
MSARMPQMRTAALVCRLLAEILFLLPRERTLSVEAADADLQELPPTSTSACACDLAWVLEHRTTPPPYNDKKFPPDPPDTSVDPEAPLLCDRYIEMDPLGLSAMYPMQMIDAANTAKCPADLAFFLADCVVAENHRLHNILLDAAVEQLAAAGVQCYEMSRYERLIPAREILLNYEANIEFMAHRDSIYDFPLYGRWIRLGDLKSAVVDQVVQQELGNYNGKDVVENSLKMQDTKLSDTKVSAEQEDTSNVDTDTYYVDQRPNEFAKRLLLLAAGGGPALGDDGEMNTSAGGTSSIAASTLLSDFRFAFGGLARSTALELDRRAGTVHWRVCPVVEPRHNRLSLYEIDVRNSAGGTTGTRAAVLLQDGEHQQEARQEVLVDHDVDQQQTRSPPLICAVPLVWPAQAETRRKILQTWGSFKRDQGGCDRLLFFVAIPDEEYTVWWKDLDELRQTYDKKFTELEILETEQRKHLHGRGDVEDSENSTKDPLSYTVKTFIDGEAVEEEADGTSSTGEPATSVSSRKFVENNTNPIHNDKNGSDGFFDFIWDSKHAHWKRRYYLPPDVIDLRRFFPSDLPPDQSNLHYDSKTKHQVVGTKKAVEQAAEAAGGTSAGAAASGEAGVAGEAEEMNVGTTSARKAALSENLRGDDQTSTGGGTTPPDPDARNSSPVLAKKQAKVYNTQAKMFLMYAYLAKFFPQDSWVCRLDRDAYFLPQHFRKMVKFMDAREPHFLGHTLYHASRDGQRPFNDGGPATCFSNTVLRRLSLYLKELRTSRWWAQDRFPADQNGLQPGSNDLCKAFFAGHQDDRLLGACLGELKIRPDKTNVVDKFGRDKFVISNRPFLYETRLALHPVKTFLEGARALKREPSGVDKVWRLSFGWLSNAERETLLQRHNWHYVKGRLHHHLHCSALNLLEGRRGGEHRPEAIKSSEGSEAEEFFQQNNIKHDPDDQDVGTIETRNATMPASTTTASRRPPPAPHESYPLETDPNHPRNKAPMTEHMFLRHLPDVRVNTRGFPALAFSEFPVAINSFRNLSALWCMHQEAKRGFVVGPTCHLHTPPEL